MSQTCVRERTGSEATQDTATPRTKRTRSQHVVGYQTSRFTVSQKYNSFTGHERIEKEDDRVRHGAIGM